MAFPDPPADPLFPEPPPDWEEAPPHPVEADSAVDMLHIVRILALIFGVLILIAGVAYASVVSAAYGACTASHAPGCSGLGGIAALFVVFTVIACIINLVIFLAAGGIRESVYAGDYEGAKRSLLVWTIVGFLLGGILIGIFLLVAYLKMDPLINWQREETRPSWATRARADWTAGPVPPPPVAPNGLPLPPPPADSPVCARCGKPTTFIPQYGRYYCYADRLYAPRT